MFDRQITGGIRSLAFAFLAALIVFWLYQPGLQGSLHFDDEVNLRGLNTVTDWESALQFSLGGWNLFGRSLALASFAAQAHEWNNSLENLLWVNVLIHAVNTLLVGCLAYVMARLHPALHKRAEWIAVGVAMIWGLAPIHVSATLTLIQRMTTLSASFQLLGLLAFVVGRQYGSQRKTLAAVLIFFAMPLFTLLALLSKENGALLPLFCLVIEFCWLRQVCACLPGRFKQLLNLLLIAPLLVLLAYLAWTAWHAEVVYASRNFSLSERLLTQSRILAHYTHDFVLPRAINFSPFADDYPISQSLFLPLSTSISLLFWGALLAFCIWLRRYTPWPFFGLAWFLVGHLLESSVIPLELFFYHRNYLPVLGPIFAIVALLASLQDEGRTKLASMLATTYIGLSAFVLWSTTTLWGDPLLASTIWLDRHPNSERAILYAAQRQVLIDERRGAYKILQQGARDNPENLGITMGYMQFACLEKEKGKALEAMNGVFHAIPLASYSNASIQTLDKILGFVIKKECNELSIEDILRIIAEIEKNPRFQKHKIGLAVLSQIKARALVNMGNKKEAIQSLQQGLAHYPIDTSLIDLAALLYEEGGADPAIELLMAWRNSPPNKGVSTENWGQSIDKEIAKYQFAKKIGLELQVIQPQPGTEFSKE